MADKIPWGKKCSKEKKNLHTQEMRNWDIIDRIMKTSFQCSVANIKIKTEIKKWNFGNYLKLGKRLYFYVMPCILKIVLFSWGHSRAGENKGRKKKKKSIIRVLKHMERLLCKKTVNLWRTVPEPFRL